MNRRTLKKMNKATKNRLKKLCLREGDTIIAKVDMDVYEPHDMYELFNIINPMAKARGCHLWLTPKEIELEKLTEKEVEAFKNIIEEWENLHSKEHSDHKSERELSEKVHSYNTITFNEGVFETSEIVNIDIQVNYHANDTIIFSMSDGTVIETQEGGWTLKK